MTPVDLLLLRKPQPALQLSPLATDEVT